MLGEQYSTKQQILSLNSARVILPVLLGKMPVKLFRNTEKPPLYGHLLFTTKIMVGLTKEVLLYINVSVNIKCKLFYTLRSL